MLNDASCFSKVYIRCGRTDLRKGIDGLAAIVQNSMELDPFQKDVLFLFCGGRKDRFKALVWEGDGFLLLYKRIASGRIQWPNTQEEAKSLSPEQFRLLMNGFTIESTVKKVSPTLL